MNEYTISSKLSNKTVYACYRGRFWYWNGSIWKESRIMTHRFELARAADKNLTPQSFLTNGAEFAPLDEYEIDCAMLDALENAKPCKNAPIDPVEEDSSSGVPASCICSTCTCGGCKEECFGNCHSCGHPVQECNSYQTEGEKHLTPAHSADVDKPEVPGTQTTQDKPLTTVPDEMRPAFDYSGLDAQTVDDLHFAEKEYQHGKKLAERGLVHMGNAIAAAHDELVAQCDKHSNQHSEDSFRAWCLSIGITKDSAYRLLQVSALMDGSSPRQRAILEALPPTLLYAVAKPSAPAELVEKVKNGEVSTNKEYQDLLAQIKSKDAQLEAAHADISGLKDRATAAEAREEEAWSMVSKAQDEAKAAQENLDYEVSQNDALHEEKGQLLRECEAAKQARAEAEARAQEAEKQLEGSRQVAEAAKLRGDKLKAENDALKSQPITAVVDEEEVDRRAGEKAYQMAAEMTAELQAKLNAVTGDAEQDVRNAYDSVLLASRSMLNTWQMVKPQFCKLPQEQREAVANQLIRTLGQIQGEVSQCL